MSAKISNKLELSEYETSYEAFQDTLDDREDDNTDDFRARTVSRWKSQSPDQGSAVLDSRIGNRKSDFMDPLFRYCCCLSEMLHLMETCCSATLQGRLRQVIRGLGRYRELIMSLLLAFSRTRQIQRLRRASAFTHVTATSCSEINCRGMKLSL